MKQSIKLISVLLTISINCFITTKAQSVDVNDSLALVDLYNSTHGLNWRTNTNWLTTNPVSTWYGISITGTRVTKIGLSSNKLKGKLPASIGNLIQLQYLYLGINKLEGSIPATIGNLVNLQALLLYSNNFEGDIPALIGKLVKLQIFNASNNHLSGSIPPTIGNLVNLTELNLYHNQLSSAIPALIGKLVKLVIFNVSYNQLSGSIPYSIGNLVNLPSLDISYNQLSGAIPSSIGNLTNLANLYLQNNQLSGKIPATIGNLTKLAALNVSNNQIGSSLPSTIGNLVNLTNAYFNNNQLSSTIPFSIGNLTKLYSLNLQNNQLSGHIPTSIGNLVNLQYLLLNNNRLSENIPASIGNLTEIVYLYLNYNQLTGGIPYSFRNLKNAYYILLDHNQMSQNNNADFPFAAPSRAQIYINYNHNNFNGLEFAAQKYRFLHYAPQANIPVLQDVNTLSVNAGGTISNNTYRWFKAGQAGYTTIIGDSTFHPAESGQYYVKVTNAIATRLTLFSDTIGFTLNTLTAANRLAANASSSKIKQPLNVTPNPASTTIKVQLMGTASVILTNAAGKVMLTKNISDMGEINISTLANGVYYLQNKTTGEVQKIIVLH